MNAPDAPVAPPLPELSLADLAAELAALRTRVTKLESVVTFWKHPETGVEKAIVRCETVRCDRLQIEGKKPGTPEGPRMWTGILIECQDGMPMIRLNHAGEDRCERCVTLGFDEETDLPEVTVAYAGKGAARLGLTEQLSGELSLKNPKCDEAVNLRATPYGGGLVIRGQEGDARVVLDYTRRENEEGGLEQDGAALRLYRKGLIRAATVGADEDGDSRLDLHRKDGEVRATMHATKTAGAMLLQSATTEAGIILAAMDHYVHMELTQHVGGAGHGKVGLTSRPGVASADFVPGNGLPNLEFFTSKDGAAVSCRNGAGKDMASLGVYPGYVAGMNLYHPNGDKAVTFAAVNSMATLNMMPPEAKEPAVMLAANDKVSNLILNRVGRPLVHIQGTEEGGTVSVHTTLDENNMRATMGASSQGAAVQISTMDGVQLASMHGHTYGGALSLNNELGFNRVAVSVNEDMGTLRLDCSGTRGVSACASPMGGGIITYDPEGKARAALPAGLLEQDDEEDDD